MTDSTAPIPSGVQNGRLPSTPSNCPIARLRAQTWVSRLWVPVSVLSFGLGRTSTMLSGPRLLALLAVGSYPSPAAEGRLWKYLPIGLPLLSVNDCPRSDDPTVFPSAVLM